MSDDPIHRLNAALEGRYSIERELGAGGMATVYLAEDLRHHRKVAFKVLKPELAAVLGAERFVQEITTTAQLQHPHILPLFDSGTADGFLFYVMPYVEGETLRQRLDREKQLPVDEAVRIATAVAGALDYAHRRGVVHRDVKPGNILIQDGQRVVGDFGIALAVGAAGGTRLTETGLSVGTPYVGIRAGGNDDIWIKQLDRGPPSRLTVGDSADFRPGWAPDGRTVTYISNRAGKPELHARRADGTGADSLVLDLEIPINEAVTSHDGQWRVLRTNELGTGRDILALRVGQDTVPPRWRCDEGGRPLRAPRHAVVCGVSLTVTAERLVRLDTIPRGHRWSI